MTEDKEDQRQAHTHDHTDYQNAQIPSGFYLFSRFLVHFSVSAPNPPLHDNAILAREV
jgi:hypothetical protein